MLTYIPLSNSSGYCLSLNLDSEPSKTYKFEGNYDKLSITYNEGNSNIFSLFPFGGPMMIVGKFFIDDNNYVLDQITFDKTRNRFILKFKNNEARS